jgi:hypothetical protein
MIYQYGKLLLLASMILIGTACSKYPTTQSEDFRWNPSNHLGGDSWSAMRDAERHERRLVSVETPRQHHAACTLEPWKAI